MSENNSKRLIDIRAALNDRYFVENLVGLKKSKEIQAAFKEKGIELSLDEINKIKILMGKISETDDALLNDDLDSVAGGINLSTLTPDTIEIIQEFKKRIRSGEFGINY